jgi:hypothetical protein
MDVRMGKPGRLKTCHSCKGELTQGTETSKYLEEEKSNEIPQVAASERGLAQTILHVGMGL